MRGIADLLHPVLNSNLVVEKRAYGFSWGEEASEILRLLCRGDGDREADGSWQVKCTTCSRRGLSFPHLPLSRKSSSESPSSLRGTVPGASSPQSRPSLLDCSRYSRANKQSYPTDSPLWNPKYTDKIRSADDLEPADRGCALEHVPQNDNCNLSDDLSCPQNLNGYGSTSDSAITSFDKRRGCEGPNHPSLFGTQRVHWSITL
jgi:hypothetical protein